MNDNTEQSMYVSKHYVMDPELDDMLFDGHELKVGMLVLIGDSVMRQDTANLDRQQYAIGTPGRQYLTDALDESNRWCEVMRIAYSQGHEAGIVSFLGRYSDDTLRKRTYNVQYPWLVRKYTIPQEPEREDTTLRVVS